MRTCDGTCFQTATGDECKCRSKPVTRRKGWRFGSQAEPAIVEFYIRLCGSCAHRFDESQRETNLEAMAS